MYILPLIHGIHFYGNLGTAVGLAILFSLILWAVEALALFVAAIWTVSTLGLALVFIIPLWVLGFWILPALALKLVAHFIPQTLAIAGWLPAILGGFVMLVIGMITGIKRFRSTLDSRRQ
jgi:hypothetical protein